MLPQKCVAADRTHLPYRLGKAKVPGVGFFIAGGGRLLVWKLILETSAPFGKGTNRTARGEDYGDKSLR